MDAIRPYTAAIVASWESLLWTCTVTPRFRKQLQTTIHTYQEIEKQQNPDLRQTFNSFEAFRDEIDNYWRQIFGNPITTSVLFNHILIFQEFLKGKLLEDYVGRSYMVNANILFLGRFMGSLEDREQAARQVGAKLDSLDTIYEERVIFVLRELMLDRAHVESKMRTALARGGRPGSDIQLLIDRCDWESLAIVLIQDQLLITELFLKGDDDEKKIQRGMREIQKKYFLELISPSRFTLSKHARSLLGKSTRPDMAQPASNHFPINPPPYSDLEEEAGRSYNPENKEMKGHEKSSEKKLGY